MQLSKGALTGHYVAVDHEAGRAGHTPTARLGDGRTDFSGAVAVLQAGAEGIRIEVTGRLAGADMARREWQGEGRIPRATLRANIDYGTAQALTTFGRIGVKVWIYKGEILREEDKPEPRDVYTTP